MRKKKRHLLLKVIGICLALLALGAFVGVPYKYSNAKAATYATEHAEKRSRGYCALYVRKAIEAGGCPTFFFRGAGCDYMQILPAAGFKEVPRKGYQEQVGDIVVFPAVKGHAYGHIAIWNGTQWVSDFTQRNFIVSSGYGSSDYRYFRQHDGWCRRKIFRNVMPTIKGMLK